jgi:hypothetical protein
VLTRAGEADEDLINNNASSRYQPNADFAHSLSMDGAAGDGSRDDTADLQAALDGTVTTPTILSTATSPASDDEIVAPLLFSASTFLYTNGGETGGAMSPVAPAPRRWRTPPPTFAEEEEEEAAKARA